MTKFKLYPNLMITEDLFKKMLNERITLGRNLLKPENEYDNYEKVYVFDEWNRYNLQLIKQSFYAGIDKGNNCFDQYFRAGFPLEIDRNEIYGHYVEELLKVKIATLDYIGRNSADNGMVGPDRRDFTEEILRHKINRVIEEVFFKVLVIDFTNKEKYHKDIDIEKIFKFLETAGLHGILYHPLQDYTIMDCLHLEKLYKSELLARPNYAIINFPSDKEKLRELKEIKGEILAKTLGVLIGKFSEYYKSNISVIGNYNLTSYEKFELESEHNHKWLKEHDICKYCEEEYVLIRDIAKAGYRLNIVNVLNNMRL